MNYNSKRYDFYNDKEGCGAMGKVNDEGFSLIARQEGRLPA